VSVLIERALDALEAAWGRRPAAGEVRVSFPSRAVFDTTAPGGEHAVVKVDADPSRPDRELLAMRHAAAAGVPVPRIVTTATVGDDLRVLVIEFVPGPLLGGPGASPASWRATGAVLARLHAAAPPPRAPAFGRDEPWWTFVRGWVERERVLLPSLGLDLRGIDVGAVCDEVLGALDALERPGGGGGVGVGTSTGVVPLVVVHGDLQPEHVVLGGDGEVAALLDWGDAGLADPAWEIAVLTLDDPERLGAVLEGYGAPGAERLRIERAHRPYRLLRYLGEISWLVEHGFDPAASVAGLAAMRR
jgi:hypothetical protein